MWCIPAAPAAGLGGDLHCLSVLRGLGQPRFQPPKAGFSALSLVGFIQCGTPSSVQRARSCQVLQWGRRMPLQQGCFQALGAVALGSCWCWDRGRGTEQAALAC